MLLLDAISVHWKCRRQQAARLFAAGKETQGAIARRLRRQSPERHAVVSRVAHGRARRVARRWPRRAQASLGVRSRWSASKRPCARARARMASARASGPCPALHWMIKQLTGVQYHPGHVWRLLGALDWTLQRPAKRAKERNEAAIRHWITTRWPAVKKTLGVGAPGSSSRTRAASPSGRPSAARGRHAAKRRS